MDFPTAKTQGNCRLVIARCRIADSNCSADDNVPFLDYAFVEHGKVLELTARVAEGWEKKQRTFGFAERVVIDIRGDTRVQASVQILPRPSGFHPFLREFPSGLLTSGNYRNLSYELSGPRLRIRVRLFDAVTGLNLDLPFNITSNNKLDVRWLVEQAALFEGVRLELQVLLVFQPSPGIPPPQVRDWFRRFYPGGLPSLGKRQ